MAPVLFLNLAAVVLLVMRWDVTFLSQFKVHGGNNLGNMVASYFIKKHLWCCTQKRIRKKKKKKEERKGKEALNL